jgi:Tol biopolymer transport system component
MPQRIAFVSNQSDNKDVYVMNTDGSNVVQLTNSPADDYSPSWSPDGKLIAFVSNRNYHDNTVYSSSETDIFIMNEDGTNLIQLTDNPSFNTTPTWSPDGHRIAFVSTRDMSLPNIYTIDIDGSNLKQLTQRTYDVHPAWSPDGQYILFSSHRGVYTSGSTDSLDIYIMKTDGTNVVRLTNTVGIQMAPVWSPDGKKILFLSDLKGFDQEFDLYVMNVDGTSLTRLTTKQLVYSHATWSSDSKCIIFDKETIQHSGKSTIYSIGADGSNETQLITISNSFWPVWQP